jgi:hypothetical protein
MANQHVFRVDRFNVPRSARSEFVGRVRDTHKLLAQLPGFVRDVLLEQSAGPDEINLVTMAEWESQEAVEKAKAMVGELHRQMGFEPRAMMARLGIRAELGSYRPLAEA